jgi:hypothetical protein
MNFFYNPTTNFKKPYLIINLDEINVDFTLSFPDIDISLEKKYTLNSEEKEQFEYLRSLGLESAFLSKLAKKYNFYNEILHQNSNIFMITDGIELGFHLEIDENDRQLKITSNTI